MQDRVPQARFSLLTGALGMPLYMRVKLGLPRHRDSFWDLQGHFSKSWESMHEDLGPRATLAPCVFMLGPTWPHASTLGPVLGPALIHTS